MQTQRLTWWCGLAAVANALEVLGIHEDQEKIATLCHVTKKHGTDEHEVMRALLSFGVTVEPWNNRRQLRSFQWLQGHVWDRGPVILCVERDRHWTTVVGAVGQTSFWEFDPASGRGWRLHDYASLMAKWRYSASKPNYYGIGVSP